VEPAWARERVLRAGVCGGAEGGAEAGAEEDEQAGEEVGRGDMSIEVEETRWCRAVLAVGCWAMRLAARGWLGSLVARPVGLLLLRYYRLFPLARARVVEEEGRVP
jgi:hypothetical protein